MNGTFDENELLNECGQENNITRLLIDMWTTPIPHGKVFFQLDSKQYMPFNLLNFFVCTLYTKESWT